MGARRATPGDERAFAALPYLGGLVGADGDDLALAIARHRALDHLRQHQRRPAVPIPLDDLAPLTTPEADAVESLSTDAALALIASLPTDQAETMAMLFAVKAAALATAVVGTGGVALAASTDALPNPLHPHAVPATSATPHRAGQPEISGQPGGSARSSPALVRLCRPLVSAAHRPAGVDTLCATLLSTPTQPIEPRPVRHRRGPVTCPPSDPAGTPPPTPPTIPLVSRAFIPPPTARLHRPRTPPNDARGR